ncbi:MAG TPA: hypothetical protein VG294_07820 [Solirubrobacteraceae bacterium]|nr:hypothetical protein [Solirubrobacteraceae bacterium]
MLTAIVGLLGVIIGLAVGRGYTFWSTRRSELAEALTASATLAEELRGLRDSIAQGAPDWDVAQNRVAETWRDNRRWFLLHLGPNAAEALGRSMLEPGKPVARFGIEGLIETMDALAELFWEEHQAFILVPLVHYITGDTVSKRLEGIVDRSTKVVPPRKRGRMERLVKTWHTPAGISAPPEETSVRHPDPR